MGNNVQHRPVRLPATLVFLDKGLSTEQHSGIFIGEQKRERETEKEREKGVCVCVRERERERKGVYMCESERERLDSYMPQPSWLLGE